MVAGGVVVPDDVGQGEDALQDGTEIPSTVRPPWRSSLRRWFEVWSLRLIICGALRLPCSCRGEVVSQPLCPGMADMELSADRAHRGNPARRQLPCEHLSRPLLQRIRAEPGPGCSARRNLGTADDHHEQLVRADQRNRGPRGHPAPATPWPRPCTTLAASVVAMPRPSSHRASAGTGVLRPAESSITIELA